MEIIRKEFSFPSADGIHDVFACVWTEKGRTRYKGVVQFAHGMSEYILRYEKLAIYLIKQGYMVCGNDHLGHGNTMVNFDEAGYFGEGEENWHFLVEDMHALTDIIKKEYGEKHYFIIGHSMGSFLSRAFGEKYGTEIDGAIFMGTSGGHKMIDLVIAGASEEAKLRGPMTRGGSIDALVMESFNLRYPEKRTPYDWISRDTQLVDKFMADDKCGFMFTFGGYRDLFKLLKYVNSDEWYDNMPKDLPMLFLSGDEDPVGDYGKGVDEVYKRLIEKGCSDVSMRIFEGMRHEIINELEKCLAWRAIANWLDAHTA